MKYWLLFLLLLSGFAAQAQTSVYHPFPESNAVWNYYHSYLCQSNGDITDTYSITLSNDTVINGQTYHKLETPYTQRVLQGSCTNATNIITYQGAIRQEISNKKVYFCPPDSLTTSEFLLYDFNMQVGDTVKGYITQSYFGIDTVYSIDSVLIGGSYRKRWTIIDNCIGFSYKIIEGIGSSIGLVRKSAGCVGLQVFRLMCYKQDGQNLYNYGNTTTCNIITSLSTAPKPEAFQVDIFPNPASGDFNIHFENTTDFDELIITDMLGRKVRQQTVLGQSETIIKSLPAGQYVLTLTNRSGHQINKRISRYR